MGTAFSSSLLGLAGSLVLGFLELQASHAHDRFYNRARGMAVGHHRADAGAAAYPPTTSTASSRPRSRTCSARSTDLTERLGEQPGGGAIAAPADTRSRSEELAKGVNQLVRQMRAEQKVVREWVDEQAAQQSEVAYVLKELAANVERRG